MTAWLWLLLPVAAFALTRVANTRLIVPAWREGRLSSGAAALAVAALRGLTVSCLVAAITLIAGLPSIPGLLSALAAGGIYFAVSRHSIRRMFDRADRPPPG
ncbi:MAG TPA: hypothetical protein VFY43_01155 [Candidatus Limnocylindria bacterium]|nr:hypothetical protein [Candidatus Limnocylindria bacterium]